MALLEITIPTFNRADQLEANLPNLCRQVRDLGTGSVTIRVVDDASTDPSVAIVLERLSDEFPFLVVETNEVNLGLEGNVTSAIMTTSAEFGVVPGDDDLFTQGGLRRIVHHLEQVDSAVGLVVLDKRRVNLAGSLYVSDISGSRPPRTGTRAETIFYDSPTAFCVEVGPLSGLGLTSTTVFRAAPCRGVDAGRYLELTVFPQVGIWLEAFAHRPLVFVDEALVVQRTMPAEAKLAEARGRREEAHMDPESKGPQYLGVPYAAKLQRLMDVHALAFRDVCRFPEGLLTTGSAVDFIRDMARTALEIGIEFRPDVSLDARRFFAKLDRHLGAEIDLAIGR